MLVLVLIIISALVSVAHLFSFPLSFLFFFFNDPSTTEIYTLSLHDALPISGRDPGDLLLPLVERLDVLERRGDDRLRSEEHTSELQSPMYLVCRLLLEKKKKKKQKKITREKSSK